MVNTSEQLHLRALAEKNSMLTRKLPLLAPIITLFFFATFAQAADLDGAQKAIVVIETDTGQGSGVLLESDGVIATNLHVIEDASDISVRIYSNEVYEDVDVIDVDETKDLALLKVKGFDLPTAQLGNSNNVKSGQDVFAIGAPRGLEQTVSRGIISAVRVMDGGFKSIQTDAAISPGSSGGGLFSEASELIAILAAYRGDGQNLNFAIPINYVRGMLSQPVKYTEAEFVSMNWQTPSFGEAATTATSLEKLRRWTQKLSENAELEVTEAEDFFLVTVGEMGIMLRLFNDLLWIVMPLGEDFTGEQFASTREQLIAWLELSSEIDYAYVTLDEKEPSVAYELSMSGSSYDAFEIGFYAVLKGAMKVIETAETTTPAEDYSRKPPVDKNYDSSGLRYVEPAGLGVEFGFRAFLWDAEVTDDDGFQFNTKRGDEKYVKAYTEELAFEVRDEEALHLILSSYLEALDYLDDVSIIDQGNREVHSSSAGWVQYSGVTEGTQAYFYSTVLMYQGKLLTLHTWSLEPNWQDMDETMVEFLSNIK